MDGVDLASFLWQHYSRGRWITFSDEDTRTLNKAIKKNQKTVSLQRKSVLIHFDCMILEHKTSSIEEKIRPVIYNSGFFSWMFLKDENFYSYKADIMFLLEIAYERREKVFKYYDNGDFEINLDTFQEMDENSREMKPVTREEVHIPSLSSEIFNISLNTSALRRMHENAPLNSKTRYITVPSLSTSILKSENMKDIIPPSGTNIPDSIDIKVSVDKFCPNQKNFYVFFENGKHYGVTLSFVKLQLNSNKFLILQLLKSKITDSYQLFARSGRTGTDGKATLECFKSNCKAAKSAFEKKFYEKTKNHFKESIFNYVEGQYNLLRIDCDKSETMMLVQMELNPCLMALLKMICNEETFNSILKEMHYDSSCVPLGELTIEQIKYAYSVLKKIADHVSLGSSGTALINACDEFYSSVPHDFGRKCLPLIQSEKDIEEKMKMLEALLNIRIALKAMYGKIAASASLAHPLTHFYERFSYTLENLDPTSTEYIALKKSLKETHGPTHIDYNLEILDVFACHYKDECIPDDCSLYDCNKLLLWHGSRIVNWASILKGGLQVTPSEAPTTGLMFGKGIYFADISTKAANYCFTTKQCNVGLLVMCEVSVGNVLELLNSDSKLPSSLPIGFDSVMGIGKVCPSNFRRTILSPNAKVPFGPLVEDTQLESSLMYNEYIVYDATKVKIKYLLKLLFHFTKED